MLSTSLTYLQGVGPNRADILKKELGLETFNDLLEYFPYRYEDRSKIYRTTDIHQDMPYVQICGEIMSFERHNEKGKKRIVAHVSDGYGRADIVWFIRRFDPTANLKVNKKYIIFGKPTMFQGVPQFAHPEIEDAEKVNLSEMGMQPHYHTTDKMKKQYFTSRTIEKLENKLLETLIEPLRETLPAFIVNSLRLMPRNIAMRKIHYPRTSEEVAAATRRLKFEELFYVQVNILRYATEHRNKYKGYLLPKVGEVFNDFYYNHLPFQLTNAQKRVIREIKNDISSGRQMNRLLQGDVGSGKTLVALMSMLLAIDNGFQACIIAPTEILAEQHFATIKEFLGIIDGEPDLGSKASGLSVEFLTGQVKGKKRKQILEDLVTGKVNILVGTHAVMEDNVLFSNLGFVVVDEQHRFGVAQRAKLWGKNHQPPHILVMTATPIPRTLAMTIYGDLDVSIIDELPPGRKPIKTLHKYEDQLAQVYEGIRYQINEGRQVYIVFPLIQESKALDLKNLEEGYGRLCQIFPEYNISKVHGQMKPAEKDAEMQKFVSGESQILVATTVIEVGVNVPNASVMLIFNSERFGLAQLHQLRGRVGRGASQSYCILLSKRSLGSETRKRLDIMCESNDGFRIAEADLKLRGPGDLEGTQQSGMAFDLKIANIARDGELIQLARDEARKIIERDPQLELPEHSIIRRRLQELKKSIIDWSAIS